MIALGKVLYNLFSARLWIAIAVVIVVTNLLKTLLLHVGLVIGDVAEFINEIVAVVFEVVNAVANEASKIGHGFKDFFTGHFKRLSHEGDYATRTHLTVPRSCLNSLVSRTTSTIQRNHRSGKPWPN